MTMGDSVPAHLEEFIGSIDQGTTSTRFLIFNKAGEPIASHQVEFKQYYPQPGWLYFGNHMPKLLTSITDGMNMIPLRSLNQSKLALKEQLSNSKKMATQSEQSKQSELRTNEKLPQCGTWRPESRFIMQLCGLTLEHKLWWESWKHDLALTNCMKFAACHCQLIHQSQSCFGWSKMCQRSPTHTPEEN